ncbi:MAG: DUF3035 domain-containing protein [Rhodospirillales bacterium]|nr:DUF3035 domain-containing protein [Rhodospirillales bacterium]
MKLSTALVLTLAAMTMLAGCDGARKALTQTKAAPDEFEVYTRAPLTMPPDYGLRPPSDGKTEEAGAVSTRDDARRVLLGSTATPTQPIQASTPGTTVLLSMAGAERAEPGIRDIVERETSAYAKEDVRFLESLMYGDEAGLKGTVVDPLNETKRIQENQALGKPITEGETPMIEEKQDKGLGSVIKGWFN